MGPATDVHTLDPLNPTCIDPPLARRHPQLHGVAAAALDVHGVIEELGRRRPTDVIADRGAGFDIDFVLRYAPPEFPDVGVVIRDPVRALIEILGLDGARHRPRRAAQRT